MSNDCVAQSWYRFIRIIGSPIALCCPQVISHTPAFMQYILLRDDSIEPHQHPCLHVLPQIFLKAMKGIACEVDAFLGELHSSQSVETNATFSSHLTFHSFNEGIFLPTKWEIIDNTQSTINNSQTIINNPSGRSGSGSGLSRTGADQTNSNNIGVGSRNLDIIMSEQSSPTQPLQRRLAKSFSVAPSHSHTKGCDNNSIYIKNKIISLSFLHKSQFSLICTYVT